MHSLPQAKKVDYLNLPQPVRYEELQREVMSEWKRSWRAGSRRQPAGGGRAALQRPLPACHCRQHSLLFSIALPCCLLPSAHPSIHTLQCRSSRTCLKACALT